MTDTPTDIAIDYLNSLRNEAIIGHNALYKELFEADESVMPPPLAEIQDKAQALYSVQEQIIHFTNCIKALDGK